MSRFPWAKKKMQNTGEQWFVAVFDIQKARHLIRNNRSRKRHTSTSTTQLAQAEMCLALPSGYTCSLYNEDEVEHTIVIPSGNETTQWSTMLDNAQTYWFTAVTKQEYLTMLDDNGKATQLPGHPATTGRWGKHLLSAN